MKSGADLFKDEQGCFVDKLRRSTALLENFSGGGVPVPRAGHGGTDGAWSAAMVRIPKYRIQHCSTRLANGAGTAAPRRIAANCNDENQTASDETDTMESEIEAIECAAINPAWSLENAR